MTTYLINHLRVPGVPKPANLDYLEKVEATFAPYGGQWLVLDAEVEVIEGAWPGSVVLMSFPDMTTAKRWYFSEEYQAIVSMRTANVISDLDPGRPCCRAVHLGSVGGRDPVDTGDKPASAGPTQRGRDGNRPGPRRFTPWRWSRVAA